MRNSRYLILLILLSLLLSGVSVIGAQEQPLKVVATYSILGNLVQNVAGDNVELTVLVGPDGDSHMYQPKPQDVVALSEADLMFENGLEFETWLDDLYEASGSTATRVAVSDGIELLAFVEGEHAHEHEGEEAHEGEHEHETEGEAHDHEAEQAAHEHHHGEFDPHIWHDPSNAIVMVDNIRAALVEADPANAAEYEAKAASYIAELRELDAYIREQVAAIPEANRVLITSHDTFGYFADAYGFTVDSALESVSTIAEPSAQAIGELVTEIREAGIPAIFAENIVNPNLMETIASDADVVVAPRLYTDALGQPGTPGDTYLGMMHYNAETIAEALEG